MDKLSSKKTIGQGKAKVIAVRSEAESHHVRVLHPEFGFTEFIPYIQTAGVYRVPRVGDNCYIFCDENFTEYPIAWGHSLSKKLISELIGEREDDITVIYSSGSNFNSITHKIELDDGENNGIRVTTDGGNQLELKNKEEITLRHNSGSFTEVSSERILLSIKGSTIEITQNGIEITSSQGGKVSITDGIISTSSAGSSHEIADGVKSESSKGSKIEIADSILGEAADEQATFDKIVIKTHKHPGNLGYPTQPPIPEE